MDEFGVVGHIKSFGVINCLGQCADWGTWLIKALSYFMCQSYEGGYCGVVGTEALLVVQERKCVKFRLQKTF